MGDTDMAPAHTAVKVLVVDDNGTARWLLGEILSAEGYAVVEAKNADEALALLEGHSGVRAVITDIEMPGSMDGLELARRIVVEKPGVAVLLTSGRYLPPTKVLPPTTKFMPKPWHAAEVLRHLEALFATR